VLGLPESPRARRRLYRRAAIAALIGVIAILLVFFRNTGHTFQTPFSDKPVKVLRTPKTVPVSRATRAEAERTLLAFVRTAVVRRDSGSAWDLATPHMRAGSTRAEWRQGFLPVPPYPEDEFGNAGATLKYSYRGILGFDVLIVPKRENGKQLVYSCELHHLHGRWLVDSCVPRKTL
jgi:hypothetical protein